MPISGEIIVNTFLQGLGEWLVGPMRLITAMGYEQFFILLLPAIYWCFGQMLGIRVGVIFLLGNFLNFSLKLFFHSPRPYWVSDQVQAYSHETSFGLPSGHAQIAATMWGWLAVEVKKRWFTILALILIFLIGVSRLFLGVHFLSDVLLGWTLGGLSVWAFSAYNEKVGDWFRAHKTGTKILIIAISAFIMISVVLGLRLINNDWIMPEAWSARAGDVAPYNLEGAFTLSGTWFGMLSGYVILSARKGYFLAKEGGWKRLVRLLVGIIGLFVLYFGLGQLFPDNPDFLSYSLRFVRYTLIGFWTSWWGPSLFEKLNLLEFEEKLFVARRLIAHDL